MKMLLKFAAGAALLVASPGFAQETGTLVQHRAAQVDGRGQDAARATMEAFAACLVSRASGRAALLADVPVDSPRYEQRFLSLVDLEDEICLSSGDLSFSNSLFRGALFQALYDREFRGRGPTDFSGVTDTGYRQLYATPLSDTARTAIALEQFGECVSRADAAGVQMFLLQRPGAAKEKESIAVLMPKFGACIPKDNTIRFSPSILKGALAEGIYRLSMASRTSTGATK